jgi:hypothetical protein
MSIEGLEVLFVAGYGPITHDAVAARKLWLETLGLPLEAMDHSPAYLHTSALDGVKHFALWPLAEAAESCFGAKTWPADVPAPTSWIELDVKDVTTATAVLEARGYRLLVRDRKEPWGQTVTRLLSPEGVLLGLTFTPWMR